MGHRWNGDSPFSTSKCYYEEWFKTLVKFITPLAEAQANILEISMDTYVELSIKEGTRRKHGGEPGRRTFISDLQQIMPQCDKWLSRLINGENKTYHIHLFVNFLKKYKLKYNCAPIIIND